MGHLAKHFTYKNVVVLALTYMAHHAYEYVPCSRCVWRRAIGSFAATEYVSSHGKVADRRGSHNESTLVS